MVNQATDYIKSCLGAGKNDVLIFSGSGSTAAIKHLQQVMGLTIPSILRHRVLQTLTKNERWVVFVGPHEHHSNYLSWNQSLAEVVKIGMKEDGLLDFEELEQKLGVYKSSKRPMVGSFSGCSNVTGICLDTRKIARVLRKYGAFACFDFAASGPCVEIKMRSGEIDGYDAIFLSPHDIEVRENAGTPPIIQVIRAALAFWVKEYVGYEAIRKQESYFIERALNRLLPNPNILILGNTRTKRQAILSFLVYSSMSWADKRGEGLGSGSDKRGKPLHGGFVAKLLNDLFGIQARGGCDCAGPYAHHLLEIDHRHSLVLRSYVEKSYLGVKPGWTRINFPYYMSSEEFEFILLALEFIASFGQRSLSLYRFNWRTGEWTFSKEEYDKVVNKKALGCTISDTKLAFNIQEQSLNEYDGVQHNNGVRINEGIPLKQNYTSYYKEAMRIAHLLLSFPNAGMVPDNIDPEFLLYKV